MYQIPIDLPLKKKKKQLTSIPRIGQEIGNGTAGPYPAEWKVAYEAQVKEEAEDSPVNKVAEDPPSHRKPY